MKLKNGFSKIYQGIYRKELIQYQMNIQMSNEV